MKHKIVYNTSFGGFNLSKAAIEWLMENAREEVKVFLAEKLEKAKELTKDHFVDGFLTPFDIVGSALLDTFNGTGLPRHDKDLVACLEALGNKASGFCSSLAICEIEGNMYYIEDYDGQETVITPDSECFIRIEE
jgi:hypothetical protein